MAEISDNVARLRESVGVFLQDARGDDGVADFEQLCRLLRHELTNPFGIHGASDSSVAPDGPRPNRDTDLMGAMKDEVARRALVPLEPNAEDLLKSNSKYSSFFDGAEGDGGELATRIFFYDRGMLLACLEDMLEGLSATSLPQDRFVTLVQIVMRLVQPPPAAEGVTKGLPANLREGILQLKRLRRSRDALVAERAQADRVSAARCLAFLYRSIAVTITSPAPAGAPRRADGGELKQLILLVRDASNELFEAVDPGAREDAKELLGPLLTALFCACDAHTPRISRPAQGRPSGYRYESLTRMLYIFTSETGLGKEIGLDPRLGASGQRKGPLLSATRAGWKLSAAYGAHLIAMSQLLTGLQQADEIAKSQEVCGSARLLFEDGPVGLGDGGVAAGGGGGEEDEASVRRAELLLNPVDVSFSAAVIAEIQEQGQQKRRQMADWGRRACSEVLKTAMRKKGVRFLSRMTARPALRCSKLAANVWPEAVHRTMAVVRWSQQSVVSRTFRRVLRKTKQSRTITPSLQRELSNSDYIQHWAILHAQLARAAPHLACYAVDAMGSNHEVTSSPLLQDALAQLEEGMDGDDVEALLPVERRMENWLHYVAQSIDPESTSGATAFAMDAAATATGPRCGQSRRPAAQLVLIYLLGDAYRAMNQAEEAMRPRKALEAAVAEMESGAEGGAGDRAAVSSVTVQAAQAANEQLVASSTYQRVLGSSQSGDARSAAEAALAAQGGRNRSSQCPDHLSLFGMIGFLSTTAASCDIEQLSKRKRQLRQKIEQIDPDFREEHFAVGAAGAADGVAAGARGRHELPRFADDPELRRLQQDLHRVNGRIDAIRNLTDAARLSNETSERMEACLTVLAVLASEPLCRSVLIARSLEVVRLLMTMIRLPLDHSVKASALRVLAILARDLDLVPYLWTAIEREGLLGAAHMRGPAGGLASLTGIRAEFHGLEKEDNFYRASTEFCRLLRALVSHRDGLRIPAALGQKSLTADGGVRAVPRFGAWPYARFCVSEVLSSFPNRIFVNEMEKWQSVFPALGFASDVLRRYRVCYPSPLQVACEQVVASGREEGMGAATGGVRGVAAEATRGPGGASRYSDGVVAAACAQLAIGSAYDLVGTSTGDFCPVAQRQWSLQHKMSVEQYPRSVGYEVASQLLGSPSLFKAVVAVLRGVPGAGSAGAVIPLGGAAAVGSGKEGAQGLLELRLEEAGPSMDVQHAGPAPQLHSRDDIGQVESEPVLALDDDGDADGGRRRGNPALERLELDEELYDHERVRQDASGTPDEDEGWWRERCVLLALQLLEQATRLDVDFKEACNQDGHRIEATTVGELLATEHEALRLIAGYVSYPAWLEPRISACALQLLARLVVGQGSHIGADVAMDQLRGDAGDLRRGIMSCIAEGLGGSEEADYQLALGAEHEIQVHLGAQSAQVLLAGGLGDPDDPPGASGLVDAGVSHGTGAGLWSADQGRCLSDGEGVFRTVPHEANRRAMLARRDAALFLLSRLLGAPRQVALGSSFDAVDGEDDDGIVKGRAELRADLACLLLGINSGDSDADAELGAGDTLSGFQGMAAQRLQTQDMLEGALPAILRHLHRPDFLVSRPRTAEQCLSILLALRQSQSQHRAVDRFVEYFRVIAKLRMQDARGDAAAFDDDVDQAGLGEDGMRAVALNADGRFFSALLVEALRVQPPAPSAGAGVEALRLSSQASVAWRGCVTVCLLGCALDLRFLSQPALSRQRDVQRLLRGLYTAPAGDGQPLVMRAFRIVKLKAPPVPEPPATYLVAALEEIEELSNAPHLHQRAGCSTRLQLYDRRVANLVLDAYVKVALHPEDATFTALMGAMGGGDGGEDDALGAELGQAAAPEAAWYLSEDGAPPLHYNQLVAMRGSKHSVQAREARQQMAHRRLHGIAGDGQSSCRAPRGMTPQVFVTEGLAVIQDSNNRFMSLLADCRLIHAWHAVMASTFGVPLCRRIMQVTPGRQDQGPSQLPLARRTVNSICGLLQQLTGAKDVLVPILEYTSSTILTMCAGLRAAVHDAEVVASAASKRIARAQARGGGVLGGQGEIDGAGGPASIASLSSMSRDEAARIVRGLSQLLCLPLRHGQVDSGASSCVRGQLSCALSHMLSHLQATKACDGGFPTPLPSDDQSLLGVDGLRDAGEALLGIERRGAAAARGDYDEDEDEDDGDLAFGGRRGSGRGQRRDDGRAVGTVLDEAVLAAARGHGAAAQEAGMLAAQAMDGAVAALADAGDAVVVRLATDCLEAPAYVNGQYDREADELTPPLLRTRDVYLHALGVVMSFGAAAGGAARWCARLLELGLPARLVEAVRTLDKLEGSLLLKLRDDRGGAGAGVGQPPIQRRRLEDAARPQLLLAGGAAGGGEGAFEDADTLGAGALGDQDEDRDDIVIRFNHVATCLDSTLWLLSELASRSRGMAQGLLQAGVLACCSEECAWMEKADKLSRNRRLFDENEEGGDAPVFTIRTSTAGRLISVLRLSLSLMQADRGAQQAATEVVQMLMEHQQTIRYVYSQVVETVSAFQEEEMAQAREGRGGAVGGAVRQRDREGQKSAQAAVAGRLLSLLVGMALRTLDVKELAKAARVVAEPDRDGGGARRAGDRRGWAERAMDQILLSLLGRSLHEHD